MQYVQDEVWLRQLSAGANGAYKELFERYYGLLSLFAFRYVENRELAEDAVQDVFLNLYQQRESFLSIVSLKAYLYNAVRNRCLNVLQHQKVRKEYALYVSERATEAFGEGQVLEIEVYEQLRKAIEELPETNRQVFDLSLQGYNNQEIAGVMGLTLDAVKAYKKRGKKLLREKLQNVLLLWFIINWF